MTSFETLFAENSSAPSLTACLRIVLDEEVLQLLPHRIVAVRAAKRRKRALINQTTAANVGIGVNDAHFEDEMQFLEQQHQHNLNKMHEGMNDDSNDENGKGGKKGKTSGSTNVNPTLISISEEEAAKTREEAQQEMRSLVLDRAEFVSALTELLVEREVLRETVLRESLARYSGERIAASLMVNNNNNNNKSSISSKTAKKAVSFDQMMMAGTTNKSASSSKHDNSSSTRQNQSGYFTDAEAQQLVSRVWIYDKFKLMLMQQAKDSFMKFATEGTTSSSSASVNNNKNSTSRSQSNNNATTRNHKKTPSKPLGASTTTPSKRPSTTSGSASAPRSSSAQHQRHQPRRQKRVASITGKNEQRAFMHFWRICPYQSRMMTRIVFNMPRYQLHPDDLASLEDIEANPQLEREKLAKLSSYNAQSKVEVILDDDNEDDENNNNNATLDEEEVNSDIDVDDTSKTMMSPVPAKNASPPSPSSTSSPPRREANDKIAFLLSGLANADIWMKKHDHDSPFPAEFLEALPCVRELRSKIEPLVDFVFSAADIDHTNQVTFRYITELILEREGKLTAIPYRQNLAEGIELVFDNGADGVRDLLLPKGTNHVYSIEGSTHLVLLSNSEESELMNGSTGNYVLKMKQPNLKKPRILEMSLREICYSLLSERAREAQMLQDEVLFKQDHEMKIRRARTSAEQMTLSALGPSTSVFLGGAHNRDGQERAARAMHATSLNATSANRKNDAFTAKTFRDSKYLVCTDGTLGLYFYYFDEKQIPSIFSKDPDAYLKLPVVPTAYACAGGYVFVGDSLGHVRILDATTILLGESFDRCISGHYKGNHHFVQTFRSRANEKLQQDVNTFYVGEEFQGMIPPNVRAAFTSQNFRPENHQLGHACVTSIEPLFHQGHNRFAFTMLDGTLNVIDVPTMSLIWCQEAHAGGATLIKRVWGTDTFITLGYDHAPKVWQGLGGLAVQSIRLVDSKQPHTTRISAVELGLEVLAEKTVRGSEVAATRLFTADLSGLIKTWDLNTNLCTHSLYTVDLKDSSRLRKPREHFSAATVRAIANYQEASPIQQGCYISSAGRFLYLGYRTRGLVKLCAAENTVRAHFGPALSLSCPISGRMITTAGNAIRVWTLFPGDSISNNNNNNATPFHSLSSGSNNNNDGSTSSSSLFIKRFSPLLVDVVSPFCLGYAVSLCVNLEEERVFVATSSGCIVVLRIETGRVLKVFFPHGKGAIAAEATVITANDKAGELIANEDVAAFSQQDPSGEILGVCYSYGSRELVVHYAQENAVNIFSDVGKQRLPVRVVQFRTANELGAATAMLNSNRSTAAVLSQIQTGNNSSSPSSRHHHSSHHQQQDTNNNSNNNNSNNAVLLLRKHQQQQNEFRGLASVWSNFCHTGSPSIVAQLPDLNLGVYSLDSETGLEQQRLTAVVDIPADGKRDKILYDSCGHETMADGTIKKMQFHHDDDQQDQHHQQQQNNNNNNEDTNNNNKKKTENNNNNNNTTTGGDSLFKDVNAKKEILYKTKNFLPSANCTCFFGDYSFVAVGCSLDNAILIYPSRSGVQGRSENGLESRTTDFTPTEPNPCAVIHHISEPQHMAFAPVRQLLYVADQKCRIVVYSMAKWLKAFHAKTTLQLIEGSVYAPMNPKLVAPSSFHEIPKWAVIVDKRQQEEEREKRKNASNNNNKRNNKSGRSSGDQKGSTFLTEGNDDHQETELATFDSTTLVKPITSKNAEDISCFHKLALRAIDFTDRLLKNKHAPPIASSSSSGTASSLSSINVFGTNRNNNNNTNNTKSIDPMYQEWQECQPTIVSVVPDAFHFADGSIQPKHESEPPWKKYQSITNISIMDRHLLSGASVIVAYGSGIVLLFNEFLDRCIGELRADAHSRFGFTPFLSIILEKQQKQIAIIQRQNRKQMEIGKAGKSKLFAASLKQDRMNKILNSNKNNYNNNNNNNADNLLNDDDDEDDDENDNSRLDDTMMSLDQSLLSSLNNHNEISSQNNNNNEVSIEQRKRLKLPVFEEVEYHNSVLRMFVLSYLQSAISLGGATVSPEKDESIKVISALLALPRYASPDEIDNVLTALSAQQQTERQRAARLNQQMFDGNSMIISASSFNNNNPSFASMASGSFMPAGSGDYSASSFMMENNSFSQQAKNFLQTSALAKSGISMGEEFPPDSSITEFPQYHHQNQNQTSPFSSSLSTSTGVNLQGISLWLSMAQKLGGNEEKRWYRFIQWRRLEEWLRQIDAARRELPGSQQARKRVLEDEERAEAQKQSLMTVTEKRMYIREKALREKRHQQMAEADALRRGGRLLEVPLEYLVLDEMIEKGKKRAFKLIGEDAVVGVSTLGVFQVDPKNLMEKFHVISQKEERKLSLMSSSAPSQAPSVPKEVLEMAKSKRKSIVQIQVGAGESTNPMTMSRKSSVMTARGGDDEINNNYNKGSLSSRKPSVVTMVTTSSSSTGASPLIPRRPSTALSSSTATKNPFGLTKSSSSRRTSSSAVTIEGVPTTAKNEQLDNNQSKTQNDAEKDQEAQDKDESNNNGNGNINNGEHFFDFSPEKDDDDDENNSSSQKSPPFSVTRNNSTVTLSSPTSSSATSKTQRRRSTKILEVVTSENDDDNDNNDSLIKRRRSRARREQSPTKEEEEEDEFEKSLSSLVGTAAAANNASRSFLQLAKRRTSRSGSILGRRKSLKDKEKDSKQQNQLSALAGDDFISSTNLGSNPSFSGAVDEFGSMPFLPSSPSFAHREANFGQSMNVKDLSPESIQSSSEQHHHRKLSLFSPGGASILSSVSNLSPEQQQKSTLGQFLFNNNSNDNDEQKNNKSSAGEDLDDSGELQNGSNQDNNTISTHQRQNKNASSRSAIKGMITTKQIRPVLAARGVGAEKVRQYANSSAEAVGVDTRHRRNNLLKVSRQHKNSVNEVMEDAPQEEVPHTFALNLILEHSVD